MFTSLWVAYPLYESVMSGKESGSWKENPNVPDNYEINVLKNSYNVNYGSTTPDGYDSKQEYYSRGHQIPNADRNNHATMNSQTYYLTNSTPQIQNGFNGGIWSSLENSIRGAVPSGDTLYVVTGAAFAKVGETKDVTWILPRNEIEEGTNKKCPVPNYYWKAALKVRRTESGLSEAVTIGFWVPHDDLKGRNYTEFAVSVDSLEALTGFDLFVNLPDKMETAVETNVSWETFSDFSR